VNGIGGLPLENAKDREAPEEHSRNGCASPCSVCYWWRGRLKLRSPFRISPSCYRAPTPDGLFAQLIEIWGSLEPVHHSVGEVLWVQLASLFLCWLRYSRSWSSTRYAGWNRRSLGSGRKGCAHLAVWSLHD